MFVQKKHSNTCFNKIPKFEVFDKENDPETFLPSQTLPCKIMTRCKPEINNTKRFKKKTEILNKDFLNSSNKKHIFQQKSNDICTDNFDKQMNSNHADDSSSIEGPSHICVITAKDREDLKSKYRNPLADVNSINTANIELNKSCKNLSTKDDTSYNVSAIHPKLPNVKGLRKKTSDFKHKSMNGSSILVEHNKYSSFKCKNWKSNLRDSKVLHHNNKYNSPSFTPFIEKFNLPHETKKLKMSDTEKEALLVFEFPSKRLRNIQSNNKKPYTKQNSPRQGGTLLSDYMQSPSPILGKRKFSSDLPRDDKKKTKTLQNSVSADVSENVLKECRSNTFKCLSTELYNKLSPIKNARETQYLSNISPQLSPILGGYHLLNNLQSTSEGHYENRLSPVSDTTCQTNQLPKVQLHEDINNEALSQILDKNVLFSKINFYEEDSLIPDLEAVENNKEHYTDNSTKKVNSILKIDQEPPSPVLDCSQYKRANLCGKKKYTLEVLPSNHSCHDNEEYLSPVLDSSQYRKTCTLVNEGKTFNKGGYLKSPLRPHHTVTAQDLSPILNSVEIIKSFNISEEMNNTVHRMNQQKSSFDSNISCDSRYKLLSSEFKAHNKNFIFSLQKEKRKSNSKEFVTLSNFTQNVNEPVSPVLDSSQFKERFPVKLDKENAYFNCECNGMKPSLREIVHQEPVFPGTHKKNVLCKLIEIKKFELSEKSALNQSQTILPPLREANNNSHSSIFVLDMLPNTSEVSRHVSETTCLQANHSQLTATPTRFEHQLDVPGDSHQMSLNPTIESSFNLKAFNPKLYKNTSLGPMLDTGLKYNEFKNLSLECADKSFCTFDNDYNTVNLPQEKVMCNSPSFGSELDIRKFPINLSQITDEPLSPFQNDNVVADNSQEKSNIILPTPSINRKRKSFTHTGRTGKTKPSISRLGCKKRSTDVDPYRSKDKCLGNSIIDSEPLGVNKEPVWCDLSSNKSKKCNKNLKPNSPEEGTKQITDCLLKCKGKKSEKQYNDTKPTVSFKAKKKTVKKNLSLFYENNQDIRSKSSTNESILESTRKIITNDEKVDKGPYKDGEERIVSSGIEKLSDFEDSVSNKLAAVLEVGGTDANFVEPCSISKEDCNLFASGYETQNGKSICKSTNVKNESRLWKNQKQPFETDDNIVIEEFDDESSGKENSEVSISETMLNSSDHFDKSMTVSVSTKVPVLDDKNFLLTFESGFQRVDDCEVTSEKSACEPDIQEELSQESVNTEVFKIECSTSPNTKSSEGTQEGGSGTLSFPPALNVPASKPFTSTLDLLDSAQKTRKTRAKRGSLVERLRRLVRGERSEVNMFHHEGAPRSSARACSLRVDSVIKACSRLVLTCHHTDAYHPCSEEFSLGEEVVDPQVRVIVDPSYAKTVTSGATVLVYPPWQSVWVDRRGLMMYCVTKLQVAASSPPPPSSRLLITPTTLLAQFSCQLQEEDCGCKVELMNQLFTLTQTADHRHSWAQGSVMAALAAGRFPHQVTLRLTVIHRFHARCRNREVLPSMLSVDSDGQVCQVNLRSTDDKTKIDALLKDSNTLLLHKLAIIKRVNIDRYGGLRSMLSQLLSESVSQQVMYVVSPSDQWSAELPSPVTPPCQLSSLLPLLTTASCEGRVRVSVCVIAVRADQLYVWDKGLDNYFKVNISPSAALPSFSARACLDIMYLWAHADEFTIDKFTLVTVVDKDPEESLDTLPSLALDSAEGDLIRLDSVVTKVNSEMLVRWEGSCGHALLRLRHTEMFYCTTCSQAVTSYRQRLVLEVCVAVSDVPAPVRLKVKSETAQVLLVGGNGPVSTDKTYNMIGAIGASLKCLAVVLEVLKNPFGDILEFLLEEL